MCVCVHRNAQSIPGKVALVELGASPTIGQTWERSALGDKDKWNGRRLVSLYEDLSGNEMEKALVL